MLSEFCMHSKFHISKVGPHKVRRCTLLHSITQMEVLDSNGRPMVTISEALSEEVHFDL